MKNDIWVFSPSCSFFLDPSFVHVHLIPDSNEKNDDKLYFFFREKSSEMGQSPKSQSRIGRICLVSWNRWPKIWCDKYEPKFETCRTVQHFWKRFQLQPRASERAVVCGYLTVPLLFACRWHAEIHTYLTSLLTIRLSIHVTPEPVTFWPVRSAVLRMTEFLHQSMQWKRWLIH